MSSKNCAGCAKLLPKHEFLRCSACKAAYDLVCLNINTKRFYSFYAADSERKKTWKCPQCLSKQPKLGNLNTPVRPSDDGAVMTPLDKSLCDDNEQENVTVRSKFPAVPIEERSPSSDTDHVECADALSSITLYLKEMRALREEMHVFRNTVSELTSTIKAQNKRMDHLESRLDTLETKISESKLDRVVALEETVSRLNSKFQDRLESKNETLEAKTSETKFDHVAALEETIFQLKTQLQERDQESLLNDVEVSNLPEMTNENATHVILTLASKLGVSLEERDVVSAERAGPLRAPVEGGPLPRPRPLVVRLARRTTRDALLKAARVRRNLTSEGLALARPPRPCYINERLTRPNRQLFQKTREEAKRRDWKYVWTREGRIFARREQGTPSFRIRSDSDITRVFGVVNVSAAE